MNKGKLLKDYSVTESIRQLEVGMELTMPPSIPYNTIKSALRRMKQFGFIATAERNAKGGYKILRLQ